MAGLLLLVMTYPAFKTFFISENFEYLGQYHAHYHSFWRALLSPTNHIFFRPVFFAASLPWYYILPLEPWTHHLRNFAFSVVNLLLLHRVLVRLVIARYARLLAFFLFAVSKIHMTTIGYINIFDTTISLMLLLTTILFFLRYIAHRRKLDYGLGLLFCFLSIFSKDYGLVVVIVVTALVASYGLKWSSWKTDTLYWMRRLSPLPVMLLVYLGMRYAVVGPLPTSDPIYSPQLSLSLALTKLLIFTSSLGNLSFAVNGITGASGLGRWLTMDAGRFGPLLSEIVQGTITRVSWGDAVQYLLFLALLFMTMAGGRRAGRIMLFPLIWVAVYLGPTLLIRNLQIYYNYESLAGVAVFLGLCLDRVNRRMLSVWGVAMIVIGINGLISNYSSLYGWQYVANLAQKARQPVIDAYRGRLIESLTFATTEKNLWQFALGSDNYPMLPEMMKVPALRIRYISQKELQTQRVQANATNLLFDVDNNFTEYSNPQPSSFTSNDQMPGPLEMQRGVRIKANPNPVPITAAMTGSTVIEWNTGSDVTGRVYVSKDGGPEILFAEGAKGSTEAPWISNGSTYVFLLYTREKPPILIATVTVIGTNNR